MLILSRHRRERIRINEDIIIEVVDIGKDKVRIGIIAPKDVVVHRQEVFEAIHRGMDASDNESSVSN